MSLVDDIIAQLKLEKHCEGGYFRRTYCSSIACDSVQGKPRRSMSSIYYMVTDELGYSGLCMNQSDLILYHHLGAPMTVVFYDPRMQQLERSLLGPDILAGQRPQLICPGGVWKAYDLMGADFCLVSEAVSPSFEYEDMQLFGQADLKGMPDSLQTQLARYIL